MKREFSEEHKAKLSEAHKGLKNRSKAVYIYNRRFKSCKEAAKYLKVSPTTISNRIKKRCKGYTYAKNIIIKIKMTNQAKFFVFIRTLTINYADKLSIKNLKERYIDENTYLTMNIERDKKLNEFLKKFIKLFYEFYKEDKQIFISIFSEERNEIFYPKVNKNEV